MLVPHVILEIFPNNNVKIAIGNSKTRVVHKTKEDKTHGARAAQSCSEQLYYKISEPG